MTLSEITPQKETFQFPDRQDLTFVMVNRLRAKVVKCTTHPSKAGIEISVDPHAEVIEVPEVK